MLISRFATLLLFAASGFAQTPAAARFYKLDFVVKEVEGAKVLNSRAYATTASTDKSGGGCSIRTGNRVPTPTTADNKQFTYIDVGVNIDCGALQEVDSELAVRLTAEVSSTLQEPPATQPVIRQNRWSSTVIVPIKKPTIVFSSDDATTRRQMQVEMTATPLK